MESILYLKDADSLRAIANVRFGTEFNGARKFERKGLHVGFLEPTREERFRDNTRFLAGYTMDDIKKDETTGLVVIDLQDKIQREESSRIEARDAAFAAHSPISRKTPLMSSEIRPGVIPNIPIGPALE